MFLIFPKPQISQTNHIATLPKQDKITPQQLITLQQADLLRKQFILNEPGSYQAYKNIQIEMFNILCYNPSYHPKFTFKSFGRKNSQAFILTANFSIPESCETDLLYSRYLFSVNKTHECIPLLGVLRDNILKNIQSPKYDYQVDQLINQCLLKYSEGYEELLELQKNASKYLMNLSKMSKCDELELTPQFFVTFKALYQIMCNVLYLEKLRPQNDFSKIQQLSYSSFKRLEAIFQDLLKIKEQLDPRIMSYTLLGTLYFRCFCIISLIQQYEQQIKKMQYGEKNFKLVATEILSLSNEILNVQNNEVYKIKIDEDFYDFFTEIYQKLFLKIAQSQINIYRGIVKEKISIPQVDELLSCQPIDFDINFVNHNNVK